MNKILIFSIEEVKEKVSNKNLDVSLENIGFHHLPVRDTEIINQADFITVIDQNKKQFLVLKSRFTTKNENKPLDTIWLKWFLEPYTTFGEELNRTLNDLTNKMRHSCERIG